MGITNTVATLPGFIGPAVVGVLTYRNVSTVSANSICLYSVINIIICEFIRRTVSASIAC